MFKTLVQLIVVGFVMVGCGGGGSSDSYVAAFSDSYSPVYAVDDNGNDTALYWKYKVNDGKPINVTAYGISMQMDAGYATISIDENHANKKAVISGDISGYESSYGINFSGNYNMTENASIVNDAGSVLVNQSQVNMDMTISGNGETAVISIDGSTNYDNPYKLFLDSDTLDIYGVGYSESDTYTGTLTGQINMTGSDTEYFEETFYGSDEWTIVNTMDSMFVQGKTYSNIVVVERVTDVPDIQNIGSTERVTITYWMAKGIGMIKASNYANVLGERVDYELIETNLKVNTES